MRVFSSIGTVILCVAALTASGGSISTGDDGVPAVRGPVVRDPVPPKSSEGSPQGSIAAPKWQPGDPVRVMPDLKSSSKPNVSNPVTPRVREGGAHDGTPLKPAPPDAPVRVRPDLRESQTPPASEPKQ